MGEPEFAGIHHVKLPVSDLQRSREWYERVLGFVAEMEFPDEDGVVRGLAGTLPGLGATGFALRENPEKARGISGYDPVSFAIADQAAAEAWAAKFDALGVRRSPVIEATIGWIVSTYDPDGIELRFYSWAGPEKDHVGEDGYPRHVRPVSS